MSRALMLLCCLGTVAGASSFETIGLDLLRLQAPALTGAGVNVAHPEAGAPAWQVNPAEVGQPVSLFTWMSEGGSTNVFPNALGFESFHANEVGRFFYGLPNGVAPGVAHVFNSDADYFYTSFIQNEVAQAARVVNQSFVVTVGDPLLDQTYDDYVARFGTIIASGAGNGGQVSSPSSAYNLIGVGAFNGASSIGPTIEGRSKPDITAPGTHTSFSTPLVSGCATLLVQAALANHAGPDTAAAGSDVRTVKALLLNGANKPVDWTNTAVTPLDLRYGAGIVNIANSWRQLRGGKHAPNVSESISITSAHPPPATSGSLPTRRGWDFGPISSTVPAHGIRHYLVDLSGTPGRDLKATLVWNRGVGATAINNLDLFVYDAGTGSLVGSSESAVDNVEHVWLRNLPAARYNIQVLKHGGFAGRVTSSETYALAFEFGPGVAVSLSNQEIVNNHFRARVNGEPNQTYAVECSSNLLTWTPVLTNTTSLTGSFVFTNSPAQFQSFYRAVER